MKTQIIHLEAHDDTLSVQDKMDWAQSPRVLLIWPEKGKVLRARLDLILLERHCSAHGSQLAILTTDKEVLYQAKEAGVPVFQNRREAQLQPWGKSFREFRRQEIQTYAQENLPEQPIERRESQPRKKLPLWARIPIFTSGILAVLVLAAFLLPRAEIILQPQIRQQTLLVPVQAQPGRVQVSLSGLVPARELILEVDGQLSIPTTGTTPIPAEYARGEVVFTNLGEEAVYIPQNTILSTSRENPILFRTLTPGQTPPQQGSEIIREVEAYLPGSSGNVAAGQIRKINLDAGAELQVTNPDPIQGGTDILIPSPSLVDRLKLGREMVQLLQEKAEEQLQVELGQGDVPLTNRLGNYEILAEEYSLEDDEPGEVLWLDRTVQYLIHYIKAEDLQKLAADLIEAQYQESSYLPDLNSIQLETYSSPEIVTGQNFSLEIQLTWTDSPGIDRDKIIESISAKPVAETEQILADSLDLAAAPRVILHPGWWPRLPALPFRISILEGGN